MRQLIIQVPKGKGSAIIEAAQQHEAKNIVQLSGRDAHEEKDVVLAFLPNRQVEQFFYELDKMPELQVTLLPQGVIPLYPPQDQAAEQATDIQLRSPIEIFLAGLQSIGSWKGFLSYAIIASIIVWIGLYTNTSYLLVGAMLIAPFAGPAMNMAVATARGDWQLMKSGLIRYCVAILITIAGSCLLSLLLGQEVATNMMIDRSKISSVAVLLALSAGAAGAINLVQSERSSLVSGAAAGMLVAASLAPPAGVVGMAIAIGKWQMVKGGVYLLLLQLIGINLTGSLIFRFFGVSPQGPRYNRGKSGIFIASILTTILLLGGILAWQFHSTPDLQRSSLSKKAREEVFKVVESYPPASLVEAEVRFTGSNIEGQNTLLCTVFVQRKKGVSLSDGRIKNELTSLLQQQLLAKNYNLTPLVSITVLDSPERSNE